MSQEKAEGEEESPLVLCTSPAWPCAPASKAHNTSTATDDFMAQKCLIEANFPVLGVNLLRCNRGRDLAVKIDRDIAGLKGPWPSCHLADHW
jgi:hypothetical protein